jgi:hypothetical protein
MKAKFVYEAMEDILRPKSREEIWFNLNNLSPDELLFKCSTYGYLPGVKKALKKGANVNVAKSQFGSSAKYSAVEMATLFDYTDIVKLLLKHGANPKDVIIHTGRDEYAKRY